MASYSTLSRLILGLNKAEKRQLALVLDAKPDNAKLHWMYRHMAKHPEDQEEFKRNFVKRYPEANATVSLNQLYHTLISLLISQQKNEDIENRVIYLIQQTKVLYARGFYEECFQLVGKAAKLCKTYELHGWGYMLSKLELSLKTTTRFFGMQESELLKLHGDIRQTLNYLQTQSQHQLQYDLLHIRRSALKQATQVSSGYMLDDLAMHEHQVVSGTRYKSFEGEKLHYMFQAEYFLARGNTQASLSVAKTLHEHFEKNTHLIQNPPLHYISHLAGILQSLYQAADYTTMEIYEGKLEKTANKESESAGLASYVLLHYRLQRHLVQHKLEILPNLLADAEKLLRKNIPPYAWEYAQLLFLSLSISYFVLDDFKNALLHVSKLYAREISVNLHAVHYTARILALLIYFEQGELNVMEAELRSFGRSLRQQNQYGENEKLLFKLLLEQPLQYDQTFSKLKNNMANLHKEGTRVILMQQSLQFFNWLNYLEKAFRGRK